MEIRDYTAQVTHSCLYDS